MKRKLLPLLLLSLIPFFYCSDSAEVKESTSSKKKRVYLLLAKRVLPHLTAVAVPIAITLAVGFSGLTSSRYENKKLPVGFLGNEKRNLIVWSIIFSVAGFYTYFFLENSFSGENPSFLRKISAALGSFMISSFFMEWYIFLYEASMPTKKVFQVISQTGPLPQNNYPYKLDSDIEEVIRMFCLHSAIMTLINSFLPWLIYKKINRFLLKKKQKASKKVKTRKIREWDKFNLKNKNVVRSYNYF